MPGLDAAKKPFLFDDAGKLSGVKLQCANGSGHSGGILLRSTGGYLEPNSSVSLVQLIG